MTGTGSLAIGAANTMGGASGGRSVICGASNTATSTNGRNLTVPDGVNEAFAMGFNLTNSTSNSLLVGGTSQGKHSSRKHYM